MQFNRNQKVFLCFSFLLLATPLTVAAQQPRAGWVDDYLTAPHTPDAVRDRGPTDPTPLQLRRQQLYQRLYEQMQREGGLPHTQPAPPSAWLNPDAYETSVGVRAQAGRTRVYAGNNDAYIDYQIAGGSRRLPVGSVDTRVGTSVVARVHRDGTTEVLPPNMSASIGTRTPVSVGARLSARYNPVDGTGSASIGPEIRTDSLSLSIPVGVSYDPSRVHHDPTPTLSQWHENVDRYLDDWEEQQLRHMPPADRMDEFASRMTQSLEQSSRQPSVQPNLLDELRSQAEASWAATSSPTTPTTPSPANPPADQAPNDQFRQQIDQTMQRFYEIDAERSSQNQQRITYDDDAPRRSRLSETADNQPNAVGYGTPTDRSEPQLQQQREYVYDSGRDNAVYSYDGERRPIGQADNVVRVRESAAQSRRPEVPNVQRRQPGTRSRTASANLAF